MMKAIVFTFLYSTQAADDQVCCQGETSECKACVAGMDEQKYCAIHRDTAGCDAICCDKGCSSLCKMKDAGELFNEKSCPYWVDDTTVDAWVPVILEADVESHCPFLEHGDQNIEMCEDCSSLHAPCNDTYMACGGCKCTKWHEKMQFNVKTSHTCEEIQGYFKTKNSATVKCKNASIDAPDPDNTNKITAVTHNNTEEVVKKLVEGFVTTSCNAPVKCLDCDKIPFKFEFKCDECKTRGVPKLLSKCCDVCKKWVDGLDDDPSIPAHIKAYGWCSGCHVDEIASPKTGMNLPWPHAHKYANYTEAHADRGMEQHVDEHICQLLAPTCPAEDEPTVAPAPTNTPPDRRGVRINVGGCLHQSGQCMGGRRLETEDNSSHRFLAAVAGVSEAQQPTSDPNTNCVEFDPSFYTTGDGSSDSVTHDPLVAAPEQSGPTSLPLGDDATSSVGARAGACGAVLFASLCFLTS